MIAKGLFNKFIFIHIPKTAGTSIANKINQSWKYQCSFKPSVHATAYEIKNIIGIDYDHYYSFTFVRNPWDRLNSLYYFLCQKEMFPDKGELWNQNELLKKGFKRWLLEENFWPPYTNNSGPSSQKRSQSYFITNHEKSIIVNDVFKYENLHISLTQLRKKTRINFNYLPVTKATNRKDYREDYCSETIDFVSQYHSDDIKNFGYKFD
jgi:hypothetical protein